MSYDIIILAGQSNGDDIHFCRDALVTLGERYFDAYCEIKELKI